jgi:hypothetical protein
MPFHRTPFVIETALLPTSLIRRDPSAKAATPLKDFFHKLTVLVGYGARLRPKTTETSVFQIFSTRMVFGPEASWELAVPITACNCHDPASAAPKLPKSVL